VPADRTQRVKDARGEAAKEIEAYKAKQEAEFQQFEKEVRKDARASIT
jgi:V-type H+-transporting ATPase subunit G